MQTGVAKKLLVAFFLCTGALYTLPALAQQPNTYTYRARADEVKELTEQIRKRAAEVADLKSQIKGLEDSLHSQDDIRRYAQTAFQFFIGFVSVVVGTIVVTGFVITFGAFLEARARSRSEARLQAQGDLNKDLNETLFQALGAFQDAAKQSNEQQKKIFDDIYGRSGITLDLINSLLTVTDKATRRAAGAQAGFLKGQIHKLSERCLELIGTADTNDDRGIVSVPQYQAETRVLSNSIAGLEFQIEAYNSTLTEEEPIQLPGPCLFVRGVHHHLEQNFLEAIRYWSRCRDQAGPDRIALDSNYWIGYENSNMGHFADAIRALESARKVGDTSDERNVELTRLICETRFFELGDQQIPDEFIKQVAEEFYKVPAAVKAKVRSHFATTVGNICFAKAVRSDRNVDASRAWLERAFELNPRSRFAAFDLCQCDNYEGKPVNESLLKEIVLPALEREYTTRLEQRTKTLSKTTEYFCKLWMNASAEELNQIQYAILLHSGQVNSDLTVYSQFRKQNIVKAKFLQEMGALFQVGNMRAIFERLAPGS